jgi:hypothetical protein
MMDLLIHGFLNMTNKHPLKSRCSQVPWLTPVIPATQAAEIRRTVD